MGSIKLRYSFLSILLPVFCFFFFKFILAALSTWQASDIPEQGANRMNIFKTRKGAFMILKKTATLVQDVTTCKRLKWGTKKNHRSGQRANVSWLSWGPEVIKSFLSHLHSRPLRIIKFKRWKDILCLHADEAALHTWAYAVLNQFGYRYLAFQSEPLSHSVKAQTSAFFLSSPMWQPRRRQEKSRRRRLPLMWRLCAQRWRVLNSPTLRKAAAGSSLFLIHTHGWLSMSLLPTSGCVVK